MPATNVPCRQAALLAIAQVAEPAWAARSAPLPPGRLCPRMTGPSIRPILTAGLPLLRCISSVSPTRSSGCMAQYTPLRAACLRFHAPRVDDACVEKFTRETLSNSPTGSSPDNFPERHAADCDQVRRAARRFDCAAGLGQGPDASERGRLRIILRDAPPLDEYPVESCAKEPLATEITGAHKLVPGASGQLAPRPLPTSAVTPRRGTTGPTFKADRDRIEVRELQGRHRQIDRVSHDTKLAGLHAVRRRLGPVGLGKDRTCCR